MREVGTRGIANSYATEIQIIMYASYPWPRKIQRESLGEIKGKESPVHREDVTDLEPHRSCWSQPNSYHLLLLCY